MKNYPRQLLVAFSIFLVLLFLFPFLAKGDLITLPNPLTTDTIQGLITIIIDILWTLSLFIAPIMIIVAGFYFLTAAGDPKKVIVAKEIILWTLIGFIIIAAANGIIDLFQSYIS